MGKQVKPKKKCCVDKPRCARCPLRMLADGTLPPGFTVKKRRLVRLDVEGKADPTAAPGKRGKKAGKGGKKSRKADRKASRLPDAA